MASQWVKVLVLAVTLVLALYAAFPALQQITIPPPQTDYFTEFWILGAYHNTTYPFNVKSGRSYPLYLDVSNHLGQCAYYEIQVKFRNETQSAPDSFNMTNSNLQPLGTIGFFVANKQTVEIPVDLSFDYEINSFNASIVNMRSVIVNGEPLNATLTSIFWDPDRGLFPGNLFFELWIFNDTENVWQYNQRYVSLWLNMTV